MTHHISLNYIFPQLAYKMGKLVKLFIPPQGVKRIGNLSLIPFTSKAKLLHSINQDQVTLQ